MPRDAAPTADRPPRADTATLEGELEGYRRELTGFCYRMLGSGSEAEDAVQETMVRAWRNLDRFEGRSALRSWLYRIANNVCIDMLRGPQRRARPMDLSPAGTVDSPLGAPVGEHAWVQPIADARVVPPDADPAAQAEARASIRLAFVAALQHLPPKQRAVLILREVLCWQASEVAELLDTTVASVNSALQRARAGLAASEVAGGDGVPDPVVPDAEAEALVARYVDAFERYDVTMLVSLLHEDAVMSMPPFPLWVQGAEEIGKFYVGPGMHCEGSRVIRIAANGLSGFASYRIDPAGGHAPWGLHLIEVDGDRVVAQHSFIGPELFAEFGLPPHLDPAA